MNLNFFCERYFKKHIKNIHILPFFPHSSDDGFSIINYYEVDSKLGNWEHIHKLSGDFNLMFDGVINHISSKSEWFQEYLKGNNKYKDYFIEIDETDGLKKVTRPRDNSLLNEFNTASGKKKIWTTFSKDQIDLNYKSKELLLEIISVLLFYVSKGANYLRLDAIGFLWKKIGTTCIHLEEAHVIIQLFRDILDIVAPSVILITETNVPHKENISYFGNGFNEAQMVYQFSLPPLVLHAIITNQAKYISKWAEKLKLNSEKTTFFNFLASHDGIGLVPASGILPEIEIEKIIARAKENGGLISYKNNPDGTKKPYEININYFDALINKNDTESNNIDKFILSQSILLTMIGVPAIYIHSLLGSRNYYEGVEKTKRNRSINREKLELNKLICEMENKKSARSKIYKTYVNLIDIRKKEKAFHPNAKMDIVNINDKIFSYTRSRKEECILILNNVSNEKITINLPDRFKNLEIIELISKNEYKNIRKVSIEPYQVMWIKEIK